MTGLEVGVAVQQHVDVDALGHVHAVADQVVDLGLRIACAEVDARAPDAGIQADRAGVGEAGLQGRILIGLRHTTEQVVRDGSDVPAVRRFVVLGAGGERREGQGGGNGEAGTGVLHGRLRWGRWRGRRDLQRAQRPEPDSPGSRIFNPFAIAMQHVPAMAVPQPARSAAVDAR
ncbi:hypothetical protein D3C72_1535280 [compost metagenome]